MNFILAQFGFWEVLLIAAIVTTGTTIYQTQAAKKQESRQRKKQQAAAEAQAREAGRQRAIAGAPISAEQMELVMGQREIENLVEKFSEQDQTEPEIYTLPTLEPTSLIERINLAIDDFFRK